MSFTNTNDNTDFGRDSGRTGGDYDNNTGSTGFGNTQGDQFTSSNTSGGYARDSYNTTDSTNMGSNMGSNTSSNMGSNMNDSSFGSLQRTDEFSSGGDQFGSNDRSEFNGNTMGRSGKVPMGDKVKGGAEKLAGKVMGNTGMQERGQERKMGELENNNF
ncbi:hypothetical protein DFH09DRAFT_1275006 [Mycena vulgaris]|nr:hypothetical protein DFH09DRAFT_1275006 [Mycena vulgaris]